ncbi:MAG: serine hydrolase domain-containing protein [Lutimonas sp.]
MTNLITGKSSAQGFMVVLLFLLIGFSCKGPITEKNEIIVENQSLSPLPDSLKTFLDTTIRDMAMTHKVRMLVKVEKDGKMASYMGYDGRKDTAILDFSLPYEIGSTTKMFTASAILQLIEQGKFDLETPFKTLLPNDISYDGLAMVNGVDYIDSIKVYNLLNHTSGMPDYFIAGSDEEEIIKNGDASLRFSFNDLMSLSKKSSKERFVPGSKFEYSNINYIFLGKIIEEASGQSYTDYIQEHILDRLGMRKTYFGTKNVPPIIAQGHYKGKNSEMPYSMAGSAGEIISTLDDMIVFIDGWYEGKLFAKEETMTLVKNDYFMEMEPGTGMNYGLGCINLINQSLGHAGETFGFDAYSAALTNDYRFTMYTDDPGLMSIWLPAIEFSARLGQEK